jgi:hypothetical protein
MSEPSSQHPDWTARQGRNPPGTRRKTLASLLWSASPTARPGKRDRNAVLPHSQHRLLRLNLAIPGLPARRFTPPWGEGLGRRCRRIIRSPSRRLLRPPRQYPPRAQLRRTCPPVRCLSNETEHRRASGGVPSGRRRGLFSCRAACIGRWWRLALGCSLGGEAPSRLSQKNRTRFCR